MNSRKTPSPQFNSGTSANSNKQPKGELCHSDQKQNAWGQTWKQKQETPKLPCDLCGFTTTQHNNQHKTYRPPSTKHQPSPTTTNTTITTTTTHHCHQHPTHQPSTPSQHTKPATPSLAPVLLVARPPGCSFWRHFGQHRQPARVPACQRASGQPGQPGQPVAGSR